MKGCGGGINHDKSKQKHRKGRKGHKRELASAMIVKMLTSIFELWGHDGTPKRFDYFALLASMILQSQVATPRPAFGCILWEEQLKW